MPEEEKYSFFKSAWKGIRHFGIALTITILGAVVIALGDFHPEPGFQTTFWGVVGASLIGALTTFIDWLKKKNMGQ